MKREACSRDEWGSQEVNIHPTAIVDRGAQLGRDVSIGPFSVVEADVEIGDGSSIGPRASIGRYTRLGRDCRVHAGAIIGDTPQDLGFRGQRSFTRIGDRCTLREYVTIHRGATEDSVTEIGDDCFLMAMSHVGHNARLGQRVIMANGSMLAGHVTVGDRAFISGLVAVHQFVRIGRLAMVGGGSMLTKDVPPFCMTRTGALNMIQGLNVVGMRRAGMTQAQRAEVKAAFDVTYRSGLNMQQAVDRMADAAAGSLMAEFRNFLAASKRGIGPWVGTRPKRIGSATDDELPAE